MELDQGRSKFKKICVFCGSRSGYKAIFSEAALDLGKELVQICVFNFTSPTSANVHGVV